MPYVEPWICNKRRGEEVISSKFTEIKPGWKLEERADDTFFMLHDRRIARRQNGRWISLVHGYKVTESDDGSSITVEYNGASVH